MGIILVLVISFLALIPIICSMLTVIIIGLISVNAIKSKILKILMAVAVLFCICTILMNIKHEKPDDVYVKMNEINAEQGLIGLSEEEVITLLGEPEGIDNEENETTFTYDGGRIGKGLFFFNRAILFDCYYVYDLEVVFNENDEDEYTKMRCLP